MRWYLFLIALILIPAVHGEISGQIEYEHTDKYYTAGKEITLTYSDHDPRSERATFLLNGNRYSLLPYQRAHLGNLTLLYLGSTGVSLKEMAAHYVLLGYQPLGCDQVCIESQIVDVMKQFDEDFVLCKAECGGGCTQYKEEKCVNNELWLVDSCGEQTDLLGTCDEQCDSCKDCLSKVCLQSFCKECVKDNICISDVDCPSRNCIFGTCTRRTYVKGDDVCSLPDEPCSSEDCSCEGSLIEQAEKDVLPVILIHGFASSPTRLKKLQRELSFDLGYENAGIISIFDPSCTTNERKSVYIATYYDEGIGQVVSQERLPNMLLDFFYESQGRTRESPGTFIGTLDRIIDKVKACSDSEQVNIVAHSMGGLVTRTYLLEGDNMKNVHKVVLLGSPNHGDIYGEQTYRLLKGIEAELGERSQLLEDCSAIGVPSLIYQLVDGRDLVGECQRLHNAGAISHPLLEADETPGKVEYYTVSGKVDDKGDGVVPLESSYLQGAVFNELVNCNHFDLKDPVRCKDGFLKIAKALGYSPEELKKKTVGGKVKEFFLSVWDGIVVLFE